MMTTTCCRAAPRHHRRPRTAQRPRRSRPSSLAKRPRRKPTATPRQPETRDGHDHVRNVGPTRPGTEEHMTTMTDISAEAVKRLREQTGAGFMDCKRALQETGGDVDKAVALLR